MKPIPRRWSGCAICICAEYAGADEDVRWAFNQVLEKRCLPSMRSMQFGGPAIEKNHARMYNCTFGICDRIEFFSQGLFLLLCGTGVGFSVEFEHVEKLPPLAGAIDEGTVKALHHSRYHRGVGGCHTRARPELRRRLFGRVQLFADPCSWRPFRGVGRKSSRPCAPSPRLGAGTQHI